MNDDERVAHLDNGTRMRIKRVTWVSSTADLVNWARLTPGIDQKNFWLDIDWCAGQNRGTVELGANVPQQVLNTVVGMVTKGGDIDAALRGVSLTPYVRLTTHQSRAFQLVVGAQATVDRSGNVTAAGALSGSRRDRSTSRCRAVPPGRWFEVTGTVTWTPGRQTASQSTPILKTRLVHNTRYECSTERDIPARDVTERVPVTDGASATSTSSTRRTRSTGPGRRARQLSSPTTSATASGEWDQGLHIAGRTDGTRSATR